MKTLESPRPLSAAAVRRRVKSRPKIWTNPVDRVSRPKALARALTILGLASLCLAIFQVRIGDVSERRAQRSLRAGFQQTLASGAGLGRDAQGQPNPIEKGTGVALLKIPKLGLQKIVVEGSGADELKRGPGLLQSSPIPGQVGHSIIAGRRTTYGSPFRHLDLLEAGDEVQVVTPYGQFKYGVRDVQTVQTGATEQLKDTLGSLLTLTTSDPPHVGGAALVVNATLDGDPSAFVDPPRERASPAGTVTFAGNASAGPAAAATGLLLLAALLGADNMYRRWRRWPTYLLTTPVILALLLTWMESVASLLPTTL